MPATKRTIAVHLGGTALGDYRCRPAAAERASAWRHSALYAEADIGHETRQRLSPGHRPQHRRALGPWRRRNRDYTRSRRPSHPSPHGHRPGRSPRAYVQPRDPGWSAHQPASRGSGRPGGRGTPAAHLPRRRPPPGNPADGPPVLPRPADFRPQWCPRRSYQRPQTRLTFRRRDLELTLACRHGRTLAGRAERTTGHHIRPHQTAHLRGNSRKMVSPPAADADARLAA